LSCGLGDTQVGPGSAIDKAGNDRWRPYDLETSEVLLGTDGVDAVVKATEARAG
jgi:hypothetical protein